MPIGFVLSGGASLGAIQVGMLHALYERGIAPDLIVATSVGAVNGAFIASRPPTVSTADALGDIWRKLHRDDVFPPNLVTGLLGFLGRRSSLLPSSGLRRLLERHIDFERVEDVRIVSRAPRTGSPPRASAGRWPSVASRCCASTSPALAAAKANSRTATSRRTSRISSPPGRPAPPRPASAP